MTGSQIGPPGENSPAEQAELALSNRVGFVIPYSLYFSLWVLVLEVLAVFLRTVLAIAVAYSGLSLVEAEVVQIDFQAELVQASEGLEPPSRLSGSLRFDDSSVQDLSGSLSGASSYADLLGFEIRFPLGTAVGNSGLIMEFSDSGLSQVNLPVVLTSRPSYYRISAGGVLYPIPTIPQQEPDIPEIIIVDGVLVGVAMDFEDRRLLNLDFPYVPNPWATLALHLAEENEEVLFDGSQTVPSLNQSKDSVLTINSRGLSATYRLFLLQAIPEPASLTLAGIFSILWLMFLRRKRQAALPIGDVSH